MEREAKFRLPAGTAMPLLDVATTQLISQVRLRATYWDTPDHRLLAYGHTLRHRSSTDGSEVGGRGSPARRRFHRRPTATGSPRSRRRGLAGAVPDTVRDLVAGGSE
jgi:hypothetical protein